jgi:hypothetical protein
MASAEVAGNCGYRETAPSLTLRATISQALQPGSSDLDLWVEFTHHSPPLSRFRFQTRSKSEAMLRSSRWILALACTVLSTAGGCLALSIGGRTVNVPADVNSRMSALESRVDALERQVSSPGSVVITPNDQTEQLPRPTSSSRTTMR